MFSTLSLECCLCMGKSLLWKDHFILCGLKCFFLRPESQCRKAYILRVMLHGCGRALVIKTVCHPVPGKRIFLITTAFFWTFHFVLAIKGKSGTKRRIFSPLNSFFVVCFIFVIKSPEACQSFVALAFSTYHRQNRMSFSKHYVSLFFAESSLFLFLAFFSFS